MNELEALLGVGFVWVKWIAVVSVVLILAPFLTGAVMIQERQVGIVIKKFGGPRLAPGRIMALNGEAGLQADTLPPGLHFGYWPWQYRVLRAPFTVVPQGEIALVIAADGAPIPADRILGRVVDCDRFQDARKFLANGGEKGRQLGILPAGAYRINTALFNVITSQTAQHNGMDPNRLLLLKVEPDVVGIVTTLDGHPIKAGEIAGPLISGHDNFQNAQAFLDGGGCRGLQEQILLSGSWNVNPWFAQVEMTPMVQIPIGYVGVVIAYTGEAHLDVSGAEFKHGDLVSPGHKGELVPTTNIVLNWASRTEAHHYDAKLSSITVRSRDGFAFNLDVSQIIHVGAPDAPKVISRVGSMQNLVDHVLQPIVGNYFRNSAQDYTVLDFLGARSQRQIDAAAHIRRALAAYDVQAIDTLIGDITPPSELMQTQTDRKIAEEQRKTFEVQEAAQIQRQQLVRQTALAEIQQQMVGADQGVRIAELKANASVKQATGEAEGIRLRALGEAEAIRATGSAKAEAYRAGVEAVGSEGYTLMQLMQIVGERNVRIVPDVSVTGANSGNGIVDGLLGVMMRERHGKTVS
jgi:uncharacterized membrane protein YqiK